MFQKGNTYGFKKGHKNEYRNQESYDNADKQYYKSKEYRKKLSDSKLGEKNPSWKGGTCEKDNIHGWLSREFGKANKCDNRESDILKFKCSGKSKRFNWANINNHIYKKKREHFIMLCTACHVKYDLKYQNMEYLHPRNEKGQYKKIYDKTN